MPGDLSAAGGGEIVREVLPADGAIAAICRGGGKSSGLIGHVRGCGQSGEG